MVTTQQRPTNQQAPRSGSAAPSRPRDAPMNGNQPLADAPTDVQPPAPVKPAIYDCELLFETPEGFHVMLKGRDLSPRDSMVWAKQASAQLAAQGFKPVRRDVVINMPSGPAAAAPGPWLPVGEAVWIKGEGGRPPKCSIHGPGAWKEGVSKTQKPYAFWACSNRQCRPKGEAV